MNALEVLGSICSIVSLAVSLFVAQKVTRLENRFEIRGDANLTAGGNITTKGR